MMQIETPNTQAIEPECSALVVWANGLTIVSHDDYMAAGERLKAIKRIQKNVVELFEAPKRAASDAHKSICAAENKLLGPLKLAEGASTGKIGFYLQEMRRREHEEAEKRRKEAEAEAARQAAEAKKAQEDEQLRLAAELEASGQKAAAKQVMEMNIPAPVPAPVSIPKVVSAPKVEGQSVRTTYKAEVTDLMLLVQAVAAGHQPLTLLIANEPALSAMARALKKEMRIPGVQVVEQSTVVQRGV